MFKAKSKTKEPENAAKAYEYAVFLLSLKLRTVGEVLKKMADRGYGEAIISEVVDKLKDQHYLDDQRYAEIFLENLKAYKNFGYYGIKKKFMEKKIPNSLIESVLHEGFSIEDEIKVAKRLLKKEGFVAAIKSADDENQYQTFNEDSNKEKQKTMNRLKSRGFRGEVVAKLIF
jgi:SOS response regulatory protein OraA/RecX